MPNYNKIIQCRLCGNDDLKVVFDFGDVPLGNNLQSSKYKSKIAEAYPLVLEQCQKCHHFQLNSSVKPDILYATNYTYLSGIGLSFRNHIIEYVEWVKKRTNIHKDSFVFEIGSNDGTCLKEFKSLGLKVCGVDPAKKPSLIANKNNIHTINNFFSKSVINEVENIYGKPDLITSQNVLAHIDDLSNVFNLSYEFLKDDGFFVFEVGYFKTVLENELFDTIYHEHLDYHHAKPLVKFLKNIGFSIKDITLNASQGGSIRFLLQKCKVKSLSKKVNKFLIKESNSVLYNKKYINGWIPSIKGNLKKLKDYVVSLKKESFHIIGYGAPTKATLLIEMASLLDNEIDFILEDNDLKVGKYLPKVGIEIKSVKALTNLKNICIIIFAWNFADDIVKKLKKYDRRLLIVKPLPKFEIIKL